MDSARLTALPIFSELSAQEARRLSAFATETSAPAGQTVMRQGDFATELIGIEEGTADVVRDGAIVATLGPGDIMGEMGLLERRPRSASVVATSPLRLIKLTHWEIRRMSAETVQRIEQLVRARGEAPSGDDAS